MRPPFAHSSLRPRQALACLTIGRTPNVAAQKKGRALLGVRAGEMIERRRLVAGQRDEITISKIP
jgi:hypothetical protein